MHSPVRVFVVLCLVQALGQVEEREEALLIAPDAELRLAPLPLVRRADRAVGDVLAVGRGRQTVRAAGTIELACLAFDALGAFDAGIGARVVRGRERGEGSGGHDGSRHCSDWCGCG